MEVNYLNKNGMISINEYNIKKIIDRHSEDGYIVIYASKAADKLTKMLKQYRFSYTPIYGGFIENKGSAYEKFFYERSFIVYCRDRSGHRLDFDKLVRVGLEIGNSLDQEAILVKAPKECPKYVSTLDDTLGRVIWIFPNGLSFNDFCQEYFIDLHKNTDKFRDMDKSRPTSLSFTGSYVNPKSTNRNESHIGWRGDEIIE